MNLSYVASPTKENRQRKSRYNQEATIACDQYFAFFPCQIKAPGRTQIAKLAINNI